MVGHGCCCCIRAPVKRDAWMKSWKIAYVTQYPSGLPYCLQLNWSLLSENRFPLPQIGVEFLRLNTNIIVNPTEHRVLCGNIGWIKWLCVVRVPFKLFWVSVPPCSVSWSEKRLKTWAVRPLVQPRLVTCERLLPTLSVRLVASAMESAARNLI